MADEQAEETIERLSKIVNNLTVIMQCALIDLKHKGCSDGMFWIFNALEGPGNIPDLNEFENANEYFKKHAIKD